MRTTCFPCAITARSQLNANASRFCLLRAGVDILLKALPAVAAGKIQVVILGTGKAKLEKQVKALDEQFPGVAKGIVKFSAPMAHYITAGAWRPCCELCVSLAAAAAAIDWCALEVHDDGVLGCAANSQVMLIDGSQCLALPSCLSRPTI